MLGSWLFPYFLLFAVCSFPFILNQIKRNVKVLLKFRRSRFLPIATRKKSLYNYIYMQTKAGKTWPE